MSGIRLSEKHGVNPAVPLCFYCHKPKNELILAGRLPDDQEAPRSAVWDRNPCDECAGYMKQGVILVSVRDKSAPKPGREYRTGGWCVLRDDAIRRCLNEPLQSQVLKARFLLVEDTMWKQWGLPALPAAAEADAG